MEHAKQEPNSQALPASSGLLDRLFKLSAHGTTVKTELVAGLTTFITMAYIIFVNPNIMSASGMDAGAVFVATCIGAAVATLFMGLYANWPVGLAPGMGLNAFFAFTVVGEMGYSWEVALGAVFWSGVIFTAMSFWKIREWILDAIPESLRYAMTAPCLVTVLLAPLYEERHAGISTSCTFPIGPAGLNTFNNWLYRCRKKAHSLRLNFCD